MKQALLFGIDSYPQPYTLTSCVQDAKALETALSNNTKDKQGNFDISLVEFAPTIYDFKEQIKIFFERNSEISLFYFSGHAISTPESMIILPDYYDHRVGLPFINMLQMINNSKARHTIIILDCCYAGAVGDFIYDTANIKSGVSILASSASNEKSRALEEGHSIFTSSLLKALNGAAADEKGSINIASVYNYIEKSLSMHEQRPIFKCNIDELIELKKIDKLTALNYMSDRIQQVIKGISNNDCIIKVIYQKEDYLKLLEESIGNAREEVLFTSSKISDTDNKEYGQLQKSINKAAKKFQIRNPKRKHLAIVPDVPDTHKGALQLRNEVIDVIVRYHPSLKSKEYNFFICDVEKTIIRVKDSYNQINYAVSIENKDFSRLMKKYFYELWDQSKQMYSRLMNYKTDAAEEFKLVGREVFGSAKSFDIFMERLLASDLNYKRIGNSPNKKIISTEIPINLYNYNKESTFLKKFYNLINDVQLQYNEITISKIQMIYLAIEQNRRIDYKIYSYIFLFQFFLANYFKVKHSLFELQQKYFARRNFTNILDLGGGGGASLASLIDFFNTTNYNISKDTLLTVVDSSAEQIEIAKEILGNYSSSIVYKHSEAESFLEKTKEKYDLIISSNFLCELSAQERRSILDLVSNRLSENGYFLIIERVESKVYNDILNSKLFSLYDYKFENERYQIPGYVLDSLEELFVQDRSLYELAKKDYTLRYGIYSVRTNKHV